MVDAEGAAIRHLIALRKLRNEVAAMLSVDEGEIRDIIGTTNLNVLKLRVKEADEALASASPASTINARGEERPADVALRLTPEGSVPFVASPAEPSGKWHSSMASLSEAPLVAPAEPREGWQPSYSRLVQARNGVRDAMKQLRGGHATTMDVADLALAELDIAIGLFAATTTTPFTKPAPPPSQTPREDA